MPFLRGAGCTRQRRTTFLTWGPPVKVNFKLATPNSVHGCTLARPTWRHMKKGAGVHCARAVYVQMFCTCFCFAAPTGQTGGTTDPNLVSHMHTVPPRTGGPLSNKLFRSWRAQPAPLRYGNHKSIYAGEAYILPGSLASAARTVWPVGAAKEQQVQNICTCTARA